jgi:V/A-type H+-transporting ATPase subunit B
MARSLELGWEAISILPTDELHRLTEEEISTYYGR